MPPGWSPAWRKIWMLSSELGVYRVHTSLPRLPCWGSCDVQWNNKNWPKWECHGYSLPCTSGPADYCMGRGLLLMWARASVSVSAEVQDSQCCSSRVKKAFPHFVSSWVSVDIRVRMSLKCSFLLWTTLLCGWGGWLMVGSHTIFLLLLFFLIL